MHFAQALVIVHLSAGSIVDEYKTKGIKMFRLAESTNAILVHESLRDALIAKGFGDDIAFYDLKEAAL